MTGSSTVKVTVRFITIMQKYSDEGRREIEMELPTEPRQAVERIIERFHIPWKGDLEKKVHIFIDGVIEQAFYERGECLKEDDLIVFVPISSGG